MTNSEPSIQKNPDVMGGEACIGRTRIAVWILVQARKLGIPDEQLLRDYPVLTPKDLDAAWGYYREYPAEIERAIWLNDTAPNHDAGPPIPIWVLVSGLLLGLSPAEIRDSFDTPISDTELAAAWSAYRADPAGILTEVARHRLAG